MAPDFDESLFASVPSLLSSSSPIIDWPLSSVLSDELLRATGFRKDGGQTDEVGGFAISVIIFNFTMINII